MEQQELINLASKVSDGTASDDELALYNLYYTAFQKGSLDWNIDEMGNKEQVYQKLSSRLKEHIRPTRIISFWSNLKKLSAAAAILIFIVFAIFQYTNFWKDKKGFNDFGNNDVNPGGNKAILILANGKRIELTGAKNGVLNQENGIAVVKSKDGKLIYSIQNSELALKDPGINTIETPRGGQYQINLPDGSKVWINSASSLKFPSAFKNNQPRQVSLDGEGYFEIMHKEKQPFIVSTINQQITVLGTHFNLNSYSDEKATYTTLLQGSVQVDAHNKQVILRPGEQALVNEKEINKNNVDPENALDWKNGEFVFQNSDLGTIMRKISRWYDMEVVFEDERIMKETFGGSVSRYNKVSEVLTTLSLTGKVHFKIQGKTIIVTH